MASTDASESGRIRNCASIEQVGKVFRANGMTTLKTDCLLDFEELCENYEEFICDLLRLTPRPTAKLIEKAALESSNKITKDSANLFGQRVASAISHIRQKAKNMTSGTKTSRAFNNIRMVMNKCENAAGGSLLDRASKISQPVKASPESQTSEPASKISQLPISQNAQQPASKISQPVAARSRASSSHEDIRRRIMSSYRTASDVTSVAMICSSQEDEVPQVPSTTSARRWFDSGRKTMAQLSSSGSMQYASMTPGADGFAVAHFTGMSPGTTTEMPNLLLQEENISGCNTKKRPAANVLKRPASAVQDAEVKKRPAQKEQKKKEVEQEEIEEQNQEEREEEEEVEDEGEEEEEMEEDEVGPPDAQKLKTEHAEIMAKWKLVHSKIYHFVVNSQKGLGETEADAKASAKAKTHELKPKFMRGETVFPL